MKSIRLSLIVYFLVLLTAALGAVSWLSYGMAADSLDQRKRESQTMIEAAYTRRKEAANAELDRRLASQAQVLAKMMPELDRRLTNQARTLASMRMVTVHYEAVHAASVIAGQAFPTAFPHQADVNTTLWLPYSPKPPKKGPAPPPPGILVPVFLAHDPAVKPRELNREVATFYPRFTHIDSSELLVADAEGGQPQEFFQTYSGKDGRPMQRSESMGDAWFTLDKERLDRAVMFKEDFDEVELKPGVKVRRVTLKTPISGYSGFIWPWRPNPNQKGGKLPPAPLRPVDTDTPTLVIQYAGDLGPINKSIQEFQRDRAKQRADTDKSIHEFQRDRDKQLTDLEDSITRDLSQLRSRMMWIGLGALAALWLGGYLVIRLGLAPLSKMSDAVRQVSVKDFHLPLETATLPNELQPIAGRLVELLGHLQKAFAREKQAAADISHELRTPLAALMTTLEVALKKKRSVDEYHEILDECRSSGQHMYQLVERLLKLARLDAGADQYHPTETDVTEVAMSCADLIRPLARARGLALRLHMPDPISTRTDANKLRELLINLLHNAVEYNKENGAIDLTAERADGRVRLEVRDTGIGIKPDTLEHIFERFYRADPSRHADTPHAGLGLAIVKSYVDLMGGTIRVESSDAGTAFIVELPFVASIHDIETAIREGPVLARR